MQHLTPVGLSKDGTRLVLVSDTGEEFSVAVDRRLRAALRGDHARLGQLEMKMESALRPRDIQARIRAGESAEDVAAAAQTTVDAIMGFAAPVLAERAHVAQLAQKSSIRRRSHEATTAGRTLEQAALTHFSEVGVRADDVEWDAWRREDGRWNLVASYAVSGSPRRAEFTYDQPGRYVVADNDEARLLTGEVVPPSASGGARRRSAAPGLRSVRDDELPLGDDALELVRDRAPQPPESQPTQDQPGQDQPGQDQPTQDQPTDELTADHADADWIASSADATEHTTEIGTAREDAAEPDEADQSAEADDTAESEREPDTAPEPGAEPEGSTPSSRAKAHKKGRSSVPSWDEIMFGSGKAD